MANLPTSVLSLPNLGPGSTDSNSVRALQSALVAAGYMTQAQMNTGPGVYGPQTTAAVAKWQSDNGIPTGGNAGWFGPASKSFVQGSANSSSQSTPPPQQTNVFNNPTPYQAPAPVYQPPAPVYQPPAPTASPVSTSKKNLDPSIVSNITSNLGPNMQNDAYQVKILQQALVNAGYMTQAQMNTGPGIYGPQTTAAVAQWQRDYGIPTSGNDGYFGPVSKNFLKTGTTPDPNSPIIHPSDTRDNYTSGPVVDGPIDLPGLSASMQNLPVFNLPPEAFQVVVPQLVPGTPEYQAAMDKLSTAYFDVLQQQMNASTQQEQQAAEYNWQTLKKSIESNLNISLSNDSIQAWDQIQGLKAQYGQQNIEGSGLQNEAIDSYLRKVRAADSVTRKDTANKTEQSQMDYYTKFATPQQVKDLVASNPTLARSWGLLPSDDIKNSINAAALKAKYPNMSDAEIQQNIATILDENGNYRSNLYQKYMVGNSLGVNMGTPDTANFVYDQYGNAIVKPVKPTDIGKLDIEQAKTQYQDLNTPLANLKKDEESRRALGSTPPTSGVDSAGVSGTQFNKITPTPGLGTPPSTNPPATLSKPVYTPGQATTSVPPPPSPVANNQNTSSPSSPTQNAPLGSIERTNQLLGGNYFDPLTGKQIKDFKPV